MTEPALAFARVLGQAEDGSAPLHLKGFAMRIAALVLCLLTAGTAKAETQMSAAEFEAYATGKTLTYAANGEVYGIEQYLPGRRVRWAFIDDTCRIGHWYEAEGQICFVYEHDGTPQCWTFHLDDTGLRARFVSDPPGTDLSEVAQTPDPLICTGPDIGV